MRYCIRCGSGTNGDAMFCPKCDLEINAKKNEDTDTAGFKEDSPASNNNFAKYSPIIVVLAVIIFFAYRSGAFDQIIASFSGASEVAITATNKTSLPSNLSEGIVGDHIRIDLSIKNKAKKAIRGIEGKILVYDMFGKELMKEQADITGQIINSGETINYYFMFFSNSLIPKEVTAFKSDFKDLNISYSVSKIVYK